MTNEETIRHLYNHKFMSTDDIAKKLGVSPVCLRNRMRHLKIEIRPQGRRNVYKYKIIDLVTSRPDLSMNAIAKIAGVDASLVYYYKRKGDIK